MKSQVLGLLAVGLLAGPMAANAVPVTIDNGTMLPVEYGSCSTCSDLDSPNYINYDDVSLTTDSYLLEIAFEIALSYDFSDTTDFQIDIWDPTRNTNFITWEFTGADVVASLVGARTWTVAANLGGEFLAAGDYIIGIAADYGAHASSPNQYTPGPTSDGTYRQWWFSRNTFGAPRGGDLPFRLTIDDGIQVPEPGTLALLGLGFAGLCLSRRRDARSS